MNENLHAGCCHVLHFAHLYLAFLRSFQDSIDKLRWFLRRTRSFAVGQLCDSQSLAVTLLYLGTDANNTAALPVVVLRHVYAATCGEVGKELEGFVVKISDSCVTQLVEVMRQNLG